MNNKPPLMIEVAHKTAKDERGYPRRVKIAGLWQQTKKETGAAVPGRYNAGKDFFSVYDPETKQLIPAKLVLADGRTISGEDWYLNVTNFDEIERRQSPAQEQTTPFEANDGAAFFR